MASKSVGNRDETKTALTKEQVESRLVVAYGLFMMAMSMVVPTRAPMVLAIKKGDAAATAKTMGMMSSSAAVLELFLNPVLGRLSDKYGRKPFLLLAPAVDAFLHALVALFPSSLGVNMMDRIITGSMIFAFRNPVRAALVDLYGTGDMLAARTANVEKVFGLGSALGALLGSKLGGVGSFFVSAACFATSGLFILKNLPETLSPERRREFDVAACSPLRFVKLLRDRTTATLTSTIGLLSFGDYVNLIDINFLYQKTVLGFGPAQVGNFAFATGVAGMFNGAIMSRLSEKAGKMTAMLVSNIMWSLGMVILGSAKNAKHLGLALACFAFGFQRAVPADSELQKAASKTAGMGAAEIEAAKANFTAVLKVFAPILYGNLFAWATSNGRNVPGMPYYLISVLTMLAQATMWTLP